MFASFITRSIQTALACMLVTLPVSVFGDEPRLEPIPLPAPSTAAEDIVEPTIAIRPDDETDESGIANSPVEQATFNEEPDLQPIPTSDPPIVLQSPVIESAPIQTAPPTAIESPVIESSMIPTTIIESTPSIPAVEVPQSNRSAIQRSPECRCQSSSTVRPQIVREQVAPTQRSNTELGVRESVHRQSHIGPTFQAAQPSVSAHLLRRPRVESREPIDPRSMRYDGAGPYTVRQTTQIRPGLGRSAVQVTTYEVTRYRPATYQETAPQPQRGYVRVPAYQVQVQPYPPVPLPAPVGPVRAWLRGR